MRVRVHPFVLISLFLLVEATRGIHLLHDGLSACVTFTGHLSLITKHERLSLHVNAHLHAD